MTELDDKIRSLHHIRDEKRRILEQEAAVRERIIELTRGNNEVYSGNLHLRGSTQPRLKVVHQDSVPAFLKSSLPDQNRIKDYFNETGHVPMGVEVQELTYVKIQEMNN